MVKLCVTDGKRQRGRDPRDQIEELEDANDKLARVGDPQIFKMLQHFLQDLFYTYSTVHDFTQCFSLLMVLVAH